MWKQRTLQSAAWLALLGAGLGIVQVVPTSASAAAPAQRTEVEPSRTPGALADLEEAIDCAKRLSEAFQDLSARVGPAVTSITSHLPTSSGSLRQIAQGSGVVVSDGGLVVTNYHVVSGGEVFRATFADGRSVDAAILGTDPDTDLAFLQLEGEHFAHAKLAERKPQVGEFVLALGNPFGLGHTVTSGIVSGLGRKNLGLDVVYEDFIQTNADINPGNSGGPMIDLNGQVVGINTAISSDENRARQGRGLCFSIPTPLVRRVMNDVIEYGYVRRGYLGVRSRPYYTSVGGRRQREISGVFVMDVVEESSAAKAGIEVGDILLSLAGSELRTRDALLTTVERILPGTEVEVVLERDGRQLTRTVALMQRPVDLELD